MKVLLDENLDRRFREGLGTHQVFTASFMGWGGFKNGRLLLAAETDGFDVLITGDQSLSYEQNLSGRRLAIVALSCVEWRIAKDHLRAIALALERATPGSFQSVDCGAFNRKRIPEI